MQIRLLDQKSLPNVLQADVARQTQTELDELLLALSERPLRNVSKHKALGKLLNSH